MSEIPARPDAALPECVNEASAFGPPTSEFRSEWAFRANPGLASPLYEFSLEATIMLEDPLYVPVNHGTLSLSLRLFRTASGKKTSVAFTSPLRLAKVLGTDQEWIRLSEPALRCMINDLDVVGIVIDPAGTMSRPVSRTA